MLAAGRFLGLIDGQDFPLGDFSGCRARQRGQLVEFARDLVEREILLQVFFQGPDIEGLALVHAVEAGTGLTAQFVMNINIMMNAVATK